MIRWRVWPLLSERQILGWADAFFEKHGDWPLYYSGSIAGTPGETWDHINLALQRGLRGLRRGQSLSRLLLKAKGVKVYGGPNRLTEQQILGWADAFFKTYGVWPRVADTEPIAGSKGETWRRIDGALRSAGRGLPEKTTLFGLLQKHRGVYPGEKRQPHRGRKSKLAKLSAGKRRRRR